MFFKKKNKEEKIIEQMKEKKAQIDKLKEEMNAMAKLVLKDGKLQKVEDTPKEEVRQAVPTPPSPPPSIDIRRQPQPLQYDIGDQNQMQPNAHDIQRMRQQMFDENQRRLQEDQRAQQQYQEQLRMQQPVPPRQFYQQPQPQFYQQPVPPRIINILIETITGATYKLEITEDIFKQFTDELNAAIDGQATFTIGNRILNGRNIVSYSYE